MKLPETHHHLHEAQKLASALMDQIPQVQSFKGKWALVKTKIATLPNQLRVLSDSPNFSTTPLAFELVQSVAQTLSETLILVAKCLNPTPADGKLRTQSDIDSVSAKLDQHVKDIELLINSRVLQESSSLGGDSESASSKQDAVRVEARNLITRLQIGNSESRNSAMDSLLGLLYEDDKSVLIAVDQGVVPVLVNLLDSSSVEIKEKAVSAISRVSIVGSGKHLLVVEGALLITHLLRILDSRNGFAREKACIALQALSFSEENARLIGCRGGIVSLLEICQSGTPYSQAYAAGTLRNLSGFSEISKYFIEENAIPVLVGVAASGTFIAQGNAIECLSNLVSKDESLKFIIAQEGGIQCLKIFWDAAPMVQSLEVAIELFTKLASCRSIGEALLCEGFLPKFRGLLNCGVANVRIAAAGAVYELGFSSKTRKEIGDAGIIPPLISMLDAKAVEEKEIAAKTLSSLMLYAGNRKIFVKEEKAIECTVQLLDHSENDLDKKYLISILYSIVNSTRARKQIVDAGALAHLLKLMEVHVDGAKKLYESLRRNNTWSVFARRK
ncbi:vacuolar protein 8 [Ziziphus jujuba]|uniref:Vacuolar protein 8 n=1 Tax=Ziziphus jujuba TaxID=326968 RepID=A0ABM3I268_ZIZJJ|nr:vacuolar protein 8 [Ziziphus jujuba]XP_048319062.2 vacuolar protein 8 [Ziziphus jujuba]